MPKPSTSSSLVQGGEVSVHAIHESELKSHHLQAFLNSIVHDSVGLAPIYGTNAALTTLVMASDTSALAVHFSTRKPTDQVIKARNLLQDAVLSDDSLIKHAFMMDKLVFSLYHGTKMRVASAMSLLKPEASDLILQSAVSNALAGVPGKIAQEELVKLFKNNEGKGTSVEEAVRQAWLAHSAGSSPSRKAKSILFDSSTQPSSVRFHLLIT